MNMNVQLPEIDADTKQRVVSYFTKARSRGHVLIQLFQDDLPDTVEKLQAVTFSPASGKKDDVLIDNEVIVASLLHYKTGEVELSIVINTLVNMNSMGIPCGTMNENLMFNGKNSEWLLALKSI